MTGGLAANMAVAGFGLSTTSLPGGNLLAIRSTGRREARVAGAYRPAQEVATACKCCGEATSQFASVDFSRTCEDTQAPVFAPSGEAVAYHRCGTCGFLFTSHFDALTTGQMAEKIYNTQYLMADPEFADMRPRGFAQMLRDALGPVKGAFAALDFGGGNGLLAALMRESGFDAFGSYDPFFGDAAMPTGRYDLITAFEVAEHARDPIGPFREMLSLLRPDGTLLFSTVLQPRRLDANWWYMAPRNGHVSLHSRRSLQVIARLLGLRFLSINAGMHLFYRTPSNAVTRSIVRRHARPILRFASLNGIGPLLDASRCCAGLGSVCATLDPRHAARAVLLHLGMAPGH